MACDGTILDRRSVPQGVLSVQQGGFATAFGELCGDWLDGADGLPAILSGMVGSRMGWTEVPYLAAPIALRGLSQNLFSLGPVAGASIWIVPGISLDDPLQPEVMRGEESQILGALLSEGIEDGVFLLPGTHAKWAVVEGGRLVAFRTYMTGELFGLLCQSGTLGQLMEGDALDETAFRQGVERAKSKDDSELLHALFGVRSLGLFDRLPRQGLAGYLSGLLIGSEMRDAQHWLRAKAKRANVIAIGSPAMLESYRRAASMFGLALSALDSATILPPALLEIAGRAGLLGAPGAATGR